MSKVIVAGGGVIGLCTAYYMKKSGHDVVVIDQGDLKKGASFGNAGYICPSHFIPLASPGIVAKGLQWMLSSTSPFYIHQISGYSFKGDIDLLAESTSTSCC